MTKIINKIDGDNNTYYEKYGKMIAKIKGLSSRLYNVLYEKKVEAREKEMFRKLYKLFEDYTDFSNKEKEKINWLISVFMDRQKKLWKKITVSSFISVFPINSFDYIKIFTKEEIEKLVDILLRYNIDLSSIAWVFDGWLFYVGWSVDFKKLEKFLDFIKKEKIDLESIGRMFDEIWLPDMNEFKEFINYVKRNEIDLWFICWVMYGEWLPDKEMLSKLERIDKIANDFIKNFTAGLSKMSIIKIKTYAFSNYADTDLSDAEIKWKLKESLWFLNKDLLLLHPENSLLIIILFSQIFIFMLLLILSLK